MTPSARGHCAYWDGCLGSCQRGHQCSFSNDHILGRISIGHPLSYIRDLELRRPGLLVAAPAYTSRPVSKYLCPSCDKAFDDGRSLLEHYHSAAHLRRFAELCHIVRSLRLTESRQCALDGDSADDLSLEDSSEAAILPDDTALKRLAYNPPKSATANTEILSELLGDPLEPSQSRQRQHVQQITTLQAPVMPALPIADTAPQQALSPALRKAGMEDSPGRQARRQHRENLRLRRWTAENLLAPAANPALRYRPAITQHARSSADLENPGGHAALLPCLDEERSTLLHLLCDAVGVRPAAQELLAGAMAAEPALCGLDTGAILQLSALPEPLAADALRLLVQSVRAQPFEDVLLLLKQVLQDLALHDHRDTGGYSGPVTEPKRESHMSSASAPLGRPVQRSSEMGRHDFVLADGQLFAHVCREQQLSAAVSCLLVAEPALHPVLPALNARSIARLAALPESEGRQAVIQLGRLAASGMTVTATASGIRKRLKYIVRCIKRQRSTATGHGQPFAAADSHRRDVHSIVPARLFTSTASSTMHHVQQQPGLLDTHARAETSEPGLVICSATTNKNNAPEVSYGNSLVWRSLQSTALKPDPAHDIGWSGSPMLTWGCSSSPESARSSSEGSTGNNWEALLHNHVQRTELEETDPSHKQLIKARKPQQELIPTPSSALNERPAPSETPALESLGSMNAATDPAPTSDDPANAGHVDPRSQQSASQALSEPITASAQLAASSKPDKASTKAVSQTGEHQDEAGDHTFTGSHEDEDEGFEAFLSFQLKRVAAFERASKGEGTVPMSIPELPLTLF